MPVMGIREMVMAMSKSNMRMGVGVWLAWRIICLMFMDMMLVMAMLVRMPHRLMFVLMLMTLGEVQPDPSPH